MTTTIKTPLTPSTTAAPQKTKKQLLIGMLLTEAGADLPALVAATGWQPHTVRAALSRVKAEGYALAREPGVDGKPACYRIAGAPPEANEPQTELEERDAATPARKKSAGKKPAQKKITETSWGPGKAADAGDAGGAT